MSDSETSSDGPPPLEDESSDNGHEARRWPAPPNPPQRAPPVVLQRMGRIMHFHFSTLSEQDIYGRLVGGQTLSERVAQFIRTEPSGTRMSAGLIRGLREMYGNMAPPVDPILVHHHTPPSVAEMNMLFDAALAASMSSTTEREVADVTALISQLRVRENSNS